MNLGISPNVGIQAMELVEFHPTNRGKHTSIKQLNRGHVGGTRITKNQLPVGGRFFMFFLPIRWGYWDDEIPDG